MKMVNIIDFYDNKAVSNALKQLYYYKKILAMKYVKIKDCSEQRISLQYN